MKSIDWIILLVAVIVFFIRHMALASKSKPKQIVRLPPVVEPPKAVKVKLEEKSESTPAPSQKKASVRYSARKVFLIKTLLTPYR